mmetsp:Transcript_44562/g.105614  ORF Transcript_44562/g.105614 Transcript_44562/m.105614 type:complete len:584 (-) Transcript_44562:120-1871(-)
MALVAEPCTLKAAPVVAEECRISEQDGTVNNGRTSRSLSRGRSRKGPIAGTPYVINTVDCLGKSSKDLYSAVAAALGWKEVDVEAKSIARNSQPTIYCLMQTADLLRRLPLLSSSSWATRYVGAPDVCDKGNFARMVRVCQDLCAEDHFEFNPQTWVLPEQLEELRTTLEKSRGTYIVKPEDGSQGDGIFLVQGLRDLDLKLSIRRDCSAVVQRYINKPLLLDSLKFDLRMYVCFVGGSFTEPPKIFLCREGLARFCTEAYEPAAQGNMHKCMGHLTNYSLNKRSDKFEHCSEAVGEVFSDTNSASKRPLTVALRQLSAEYPGFDSEGFYSSVAQVVQRSSTLIATALRAYYRGVDVQSASMRCLQVFGFDIILDSSFQPFLLEVNNAPSLCIDEALPVDDPGSVASSAAGKSSSRPHEKDKLCRCMDMAQLHRHQTSIVDLEVKREVVRGAFQILELIKSGYTEPEVIGYIPIFVVADPLWPLLCTLEELYHQTGGAAKAFTSSGLRRAFGTLCKPGGLEKHDLDMLAQKFRATNFVTHDRDSKPDALRLFDFLSALRCASARAFPDLTPSQGIMQALSFLH